MNISDGIVEATTIQDELYMRWTYLYNCEYNNDDDVCYHVAKEHLLEEKEKIEMKLSLLLEEKELVMKHLGDQDTKYRDVVDVENSVHQRVKIVKSTMNNLQLEIEKLRLLLSSTDNNNIDDNDHDDFGRGDCV